eukprot:UN24648
MCEGFDYANLTSVAGSNNPITCIEDRNGLIYSSMDAFIMYRCVNTLLIKTSDKELQKVVGRYSPRYDRQQGLIFEMKDKYQLKVIKQRWTLVKKHKKKADKKIIVCTEVAQVEEYLPKKLEGIWALVKEDGGKRVANVVRDLSVHWEGHTHRFHSDICARQPLLDYTSAFKSDGWEKGGALGYIRS